MRSFEPEFEGCATHPSHRREMRGTSISLVAAICRENSRSQFLFVVSPTIDSSMAVHDRTRAQLENLFCQLSFLTTSSAFRTSYSASIAIHTPPPLPRPRALPYANSRSYPNLFTSPLPAGHDSKTHNASATCRPSRDQKVARCFPLCSR